MNQPLVLPILLAASLDKKAFILGPNITEKKEKHNYLSIYMYYSGKFGRMVGIPSWKPCIHHWKILTSNKIKLQECIPVGCVPPAYYCTRGFTDRDLPGQRRPGQRPPPLDRDPIPWREIPPRQRPLDRDPPGQRSPRQRSSWTETPGPWIETSLAPGQRPPPCEQNHTGVKALPCRKFVADGNN